jgi:hypothetical protein
MALGDVGEIQNGVFERITTLNDLGIPFEIRLDPSPKSFSYRSRGRIAIEVKVAGSISNATGLLAADAGLIISGARGGGVLLEAAGCQIKTFEGLDRVGTNILARHKVGNWNRGHCVVTELVYANCVTAVAMEETGGRLELRAKGPVSPDGLYPASAEANFSMAYEESVGLRVVAEAGLNPLYRCYAIQRRIFRPDRFRPKRLADGPEEGPDPEPEGEDVFELL